jgi:polysaccharide pyruvyl transferase CsaB
MTRGCSSLAWSWGYYGFDNLGDELILKVLTDELKAREVKVTVLSDNPPKTAQKYGVDAIHRTNLIDIVDVLAQCNLFISGGGGLFQDATGPMSVIYYGGLIRLAHFFEVPVCFWAQGVGPLNRPFSRKFTGKALQKCDCVIVRDEKSATLVEAVAGFRPEITGDPVWLLKLPKAEPSAFEDSQKETYRVGISLRHWPELTESRLQAFADSLRAFLDNQDAQSKEVLLLPFQENEDLHLLQRLADHLKETPNCKLIMIKPMDVLEQLPQCNVLFGMRFHSLILGLLSGIPVYGIVYDPKVASLLEMFNLQGSPVETLEQLNVEEIQHYLDHYPTVDLNPLKKEAAKNFERLQQLLEIPDAELAL